MSFYLLRATWRARTGHTTLARDLARVLRRAVAATALPAAALTVPALAQAPTDVRVALVIGNAAYPGAMALANPGNDATAMSQALRQLGFTVIEVRDASRAQMEDAVRRLFTTLRGKRAVGMLYYAGHGLQVDWKNYMVPVDAQLGTAADVPARALDVADVLDAMKAAGNRMNIVVLDACRDNPFADKAAKGLAPVDAPTGTFLAYATAPGNVAEDGTGSNGLYTRHLLAELAKPVTIESVFKRVRLGVRKESAGRQIPWESTSLEEEFSFVPGAQSAVSDGARRDADFAEQKAAWERIKESTNPDDFYTFLQRYPGGLIAEIAQVRLEKFARTPVKLQGHKGEQPADIVTDRLQVGDEWKVRSSTGDGGRGLFSSGSSWEYHYRVTRRVGDNFEVTGEPSGFMMPRTVHILTPQGAIVAQDMGSMGKWEFSPPAPSLPQTAFQVGYKSSSRLEMIRNGRPQGVEDYHLSVTGRERVSTPAGSFDAYRIELNHRTTGAFGSTARSYTQTTWYAQNSVIPLKSTFVMPGSPTTQEETLFIKRAARS